MLDRIRAHAPVLITAAVVSALTAGGPAIATAAYDAMNAHKVDGKHAVGAGASVNDRAGKLVATDRSGHLPNNIVKRAPDSARLGGREPSFYSTYWLNVSADGTIRSHSKGLKGTTVTKHPDAGRYCVFLPAKVKVQTEAVVGAIQETQGGTQRYDIAVTTTFGNACNSTGPWDIAVLTHINGAAANGSFMLVIPGTPQG